MTEAARFFLAPGVRLRRLESPSVYHTGTDTLYELDESGFDLLRRCSEAGVGADEVPDREFLEFILSEELVTDSAGRSGFVLQTIQPAPVPSLRYLELQITSRCNLRCRHCYLGTSKVVDLPVSDVLFVLDQFDRMQGLRVLISGGEPLLHPRFDELNDGLKNVRLRKVILTNGTLIDDSLAARLNVHEIQVSLDGLKAGHDTLRGAGNFDRAVAGLRAAREAGLAVSVATIVHAANVEEMDGLRDFLLAEGVSEWGVDAACAVGALADQPEHQVAPEVSARFLDYGFGGSLHEGDEHRVCGSHLMAVIPSGEGCKCGYYSNRPVGHVREGLMTLWSRIEKPLVSSLSCASCRVADQCRGGCRYRAECAGSAEGPDPVKCAQFGILR